MSEACSICDEGCDLCHDPPPKGEHLVPVQNPSAIGCVFWLCRACIREVAEAARQLDDAAKSGLRGFAP
jgi:hypothetical protein